MIAPQVAKSDKANKYIDSGVVVGGNARGNLALRDVIREELKSGREERLRFAISDEDWRKSYERVGYFHFSVQQGKSPRITIDLDRVASSAVGPDKLRKLFEKSPFVRDVFMTYDPVDQNMNLTLNLKRHALVDVYEQKSEDGQFPQIVIDLKAR